MFSILLRCLYLIFQNAAGEVRRFRGGMQAVSPLAIKAPDTHRSHSPYHRSSHRPLRPAKPVRGFSRQYGRRSVRLSGT